MLLFWKGKHEEAIAETERNTSKKSKDQKRARDSEKSQSNSVSLCQKLSIKTGPSQLFLFLRNENVSSCNFPYPKNIVDNCYSSRPHLARVLVSLMLGMEKILNHRTHLNNFFISNEIIKWTKGPPWTTVTCGAQNNWYRHKDCAPGSNWGNSVTSVSLKIFWSLPPRFPWMMISSVLAVLSTTTLASASIPAKAVVTGIAKDVRQDGMVRWTVRSFIPCGFWCWTSGYLWHYRYLLWRKQNAQCKLANLKNKVRKLKRKKYSLCYENETQTKQFWVADRRT